MEADAAPYLDYRVRWRSGGSRPGSHTMRQAGGDGQFRAYRPFWQLPDAQHIDVRRSALDPFGEIMVRQTSQRSSIDLILAIDLSASMQPSSGRSSLTWVVALAEAAARSALRAGDGFGIIGFDQDLRDDVWLPPTRSKAQAGQILAHLAASARRGNGAQGMLRLAERLPARRCLLLLVSDFLIPLTLIDQAMSALPSHDVAPVVLSVDTVRALPRVGLLRLADAESGRTRLTLMRPSLHRRWCEAEAARGQALDQLCLRFGRPAFHAERGIDIPRLSQHLAGA